MSIRHVCHVVAAAALFSACATTSVPQDKFAASQGSIRAAEELGADQVPQASLYLQYAREQAQEAHQLFDKGEDMRAVSLLKRAEADAQLALAITRAEPVKAEAAEAEKKLQQSNAQAVEQSAQPSPQLEQQP